MLSLSVWPRRCSFPSQTKALRSPLRCSALQTGATRRSLVELSLLSIAPLVLDLHTADAVTLESYKDGASGFSLSYPPEWTFSEAQMAGKEFIAERTMVWYPKGIPPRDVNVTLLINNAGADFTSLRSFGSAEDFGNNLVNSMDRSFMKRFRRPQQNNDDIQTAKLVEAKTSRGMYSVEYLLKSPKQEEKRLLSLIALQFDGTYNRLYTLTAQCDEADYTKYKTDIQTVLDSFQPPGI